MDELNKGLKDTLAILRRRKIALLSPIAPIFLVIVAVTFSLNPVYRSSATILIQRQEIPPELVRSSVTSFAEERIQIISQRVMTTDRLASIIRKYDMYPDERATEDLDFLAAKLRAATSVENTSADVVDPRSGRPTHTTVAFTISVEYDTPHIAQQVLQEFVSLYIEENIETRKKLASEASRFLAAESEKMSAQIAEFEQRLAAFKSGNPHYLPDSLSLNADFIDRTERQLVESERDIRSLRQQEIYLEAELRETSPYAELGSGLGESPEARLQTLKTQFLSAAARLSSQHPDVVKMRKEIESLEIAVGANSGATDLQKQLETTRIELEQARHRYSVAHPDVTRLERMMLRLSEQVERNGPSSASYQHQLNVLGELRSPQWLLQQPATHYAIQLIALSDSESLSDFVQRHNLAKNSAYFKMQKDSREWYVLLFGLYPNADQARRAIPRLPTPLRRNGPWIRSLRSVHRIDKTQSYTADAPKAAEPRTVGPPKAAAQMDIPSSLPQSHPPSKADNPAYIQLQVRLQATQAELSALKSTRRQLITKLASYQSRLTAGPEAERKYRPLSRDYKNALEKYRETKSKLRDAQLAEALEQESKAESFYLIEPPSLPKKPVRPNRPAIIFLGFIFSLASGIGSLVLSENLDDTVRDVRDLSLLTGTHPWAVIPNIENSADKRRRVQQKLLLASLLGIGVIGGLLVIHFHMVVTH